MKMLTWNRGGQVVLGIMLVSLSLGTAGCGGSGSPGAQVQAGKAHEHEAGAEEGITLHRGEGLKLKPEVAKSIGVQLGEVEERELRRVLGFTTVVYDIGDRVRASGRVEPAVASALSEGQPVLVRFPQGPGVTGRIRGVDRDTARGAGQCEVWVEWEAGGSPGIKPGSLVEVRVESAPEKGLVVPGEALLRTAEGLFVYVANGERLVRQKVTAAEGSVGEDGVEIVEGLLAGDSVVRQPVFTLWMAEVQLLRAGEACSHGH